MFEVHSGDLLIARGGNEDDIKHGRNFHSNPEEWMQWGTFWYPEEYGMQSHIHKAREHRGKHKTHEFIYIVSGSLMVEFYNLEKEFIGSRMLYKGDFICLYDGGHGFMTKAPDTKFIEIKHGQFTSPEDDKEKF